MKVKISHHDLESVMLELGRTLSYLTRSPPLTNDSTIAGGGQMTCPGSQRRLKGRAETTLKAPWWIGAVVFLLIVGSCILVSTFVTWSQGAMRKCSGSSGDAKGRRPALHHRVAGQANQMSTTG